MNVAGLTGSLGRLPGVARSDAPETTAPAVAEKPQEPYFSPVFRFDKQAQVLVFQFRDSETGDVTRQYPSEKVVKLYRDSAPKDATEASAAPKDASSAPAVSDRGSEEPAPSAASSAEGSGAAETPASGGGAGGTERVRVTA